MNKNVTWIMIAAIVLGAVLYFQPFSVWFETGDTIHFSKANPYPFSIGLDSETGFEKLEIKVQSADFSQMVKTPFWGSGMSVCSFYECHCVANPGINVQSSSGIEQCCRANGWQGLDSIGEASCFKYVETLPDYVRLKQGSAIIWEYHPKTQSLPQTFDIAPYVQQQCAVQIANYNKGLGGELNTKCIVGFQFENSLDIGSMQLYFGSIARNVQTCEDGVKNQNEISVDYGGVCGLDYCALRSVKCEASCNGFSRLTGSCEPGTGNCIWHETPNSAECGYTAASGADGDSGADAGLQYAGFYEQNKEYLWIFGGIIVLVGVLLYVKKFR